MSPVRLLRDVCGEGARTGLADASFTYHRSRDAGTADPGWTRGVALRRCAPGVERRRLDGQDITWHNGGTGGYRTWIGFDISKRTAAIVLTNSTHGADDLGFELLK